MNARLANLTSYERVGLDREFNLADGHAHQSPDGVQQQIVQRLPSLYDDAFRVRQTDAERRFQREFFLLAGQRWMAQRRLSLQCQSASQSIDLVAAFLAAQGLTTALLQPCFDNLAGLLRRRGVRLRPVAEEAIARMDLHDLLDGEAPGALFLTLPNNPTGFSIGRERFERLARHCAAAGTVLVVDWTFRFFERFDVWDQYAILDRSGASYLCIEDTGKTWPTTDLKCSLLTASEDLYPAIAELHNDMLLHVSPFILELLTQYLRDSRERGLEITVRAPIMENRRRLRAALRDSVLVPHDPVARISVEWVSVEASLLTGLEVVDLLGDVEIAILPGDHFYWHEPRLGSRHVRFALARDPAMFDAACRRLRRLIDASPVLKSR